MKRFLFAFVFSLVGSMSAEQQTIKLDTPGSGHGDSAYVGGTKINHNFTELYNYKTNSSGDIVLIKSTAATIGSQVTNLNSLLTNSVTNKLVVLEGSSTMHGTGADWGCGVGDQIASCLSTYVYTVINNAQSGNTMHELF